MKCPRNCCNHTFGSRRVLWLVNRYIPMQGHQGNSECRGSDCARCMAHQSLWAASLRYPIPRRAVRDLTAEAWKIVPVRKRTSNATRQPSACRRNLETHSFVRNRKCLSLSAFAQANPQTTTVIETVGLHPHTAWS